MGAQGPIHARADRRDFVRLAGKGGLVVALGGLVRILEPRRQFIRPPGALPEEDFLALCTRCGKCIEACRTVIHPVLITESILAAGTPRLYGSCPQCGRCQWVCPTGALGGMVVMPH
jgi:ferredoxin-type protein NapG